MSPYHQGFVLGLKTNTSLVLSASWLASENIRQMRERNGEPYEAVKSVSLQQQIEGVILLSEVKANLKEMH